MEKKTSDDIRQMVRDRYAKTAQASGCGCRTSPASACCGTASQTVAGVSTIMGYTGDEIDGVINGANLGLGCGNPTALAKLESGQTVLDLGSGAGFDCFLAAKQVGAGGRVIGVDMTPEMLSKARRNAEKMAAANVEFRLGEIEHLPVADNSIDVIFSNCVINLSPEKGQVFKDAFRVLKPGGRLAVSDVVATAQMPEELREQAAMLTGCIAGAEHIDRLRKLLEEAGFVNVTIELKPYSEELVREWFPDSGAENYVASADIEATKPA